MLWTELKYQFDANEGRMSDFELVINEHSTNVRVYLMGHERIQALDTHAGISNVARIPTSAVRGSTTPGPVNLRE